MTISIIADIYESVNVLYVQNNVMAPFFQSEVLFWLVKFQETESGQVGKWQRQASRAGPLDCCASWALCTDFFA